MDTRLLLLALLLFATVEVKPSNVKNMGAQNPLSVKIMGERKPLTSGKEQEVTCQSIGTANITWWLDGTDLTHQSTMQSQTSQEEIVTSTSILSIVPKDEDAGKVLTCKGHQSLEDSWTLELNYVLGSSNTGETISLKCTNEGKFSITDYCRDYFQCQYAEGSSELHPQIFLCPNGTIFDDSVSDCWEASLVTSRSECLHDGSVSVQLADMISDTEGVCGRIKSIDHFDVTVISTVPLRRSFDYAAKFNRYIMDYNQDLEALQANIGVWRKGNDIMSKIKRIYKLAKQYENEFDRKYEINKGRLMEVPGKWEKELHKLRENIKALETEIQISKELLPTADTENKMILNDIIAYKERKITEKEGQIRNKSLVALELNELVPFLEFVSKDASDIVDEVAASSNKTNKLYKNILEAKDTFRKYAVNATSDKESLQTELMQHEKELTNKQKEVENLENKKVELNNKEGELTKTRGENSQQISVIIESITEQRDVLCKEDGIYMNAPSLADIEDKSIRCYKILRDPGTGLKYNGKELHQVLNSYFEANEQINTEIIILLPKYGIINENITGVRDSIPAIENRMKEIKVELRKFEMFLPDVEKILQGINSTLPDIWDTKEGLQKVEATFRLVSEVLDKIINRTKRAQDETEKQNAKTHINEALSSLQNLIDQSSAKISEVESCSRLEYTVGHLYA